MDPYYFKLQQEMQIVIVTEESELLDFIYKKQ